MAFNKNVNHSCSYAISVITFSCSGNWRHGWFNSDHDRRKTTSLVDSDALQWALV